jgi:hypothetical protein
MTKAKMDPKLQSILIPALSLKRKIDQIISPISDPETHCLILKKLQDLNINEFITLSQKGLSEFNVSADQNSPSIIPVKIIIEKFSEIKILINPSSSSSKRFFFTPVIKINLEELRKKLLAINEAFNMCDNKVLDLTEKSFIESPAPGA